MKLLIENGLLIDPASGTEAQGALAVEDGRIVAVGRVPEGFAPERRIDAAGGWVLPGLIDVGVRLREPGHEHKATIASESRAAASAGITRMACLPDTRPVIDSPAEIDFVQQQAAADGHCHIEVIAALTQGLEGEQLSEMAALRAAGAVGVAQCLRPVRDLRLLRRAMEYAASQGLTVYLQPQDPGLAAGGCAHEGPVASRLGLPGIPAAAETAALGALLALVDQTGARTHFCRLSTARGVQLLRWAKDEGLPVSCDVAIHQLFLTEVDLGEFDAHCHVLPPLRSARDRDALRAGVADGTIDLIVSDHQPHEADAKLAPFPSTEPGISGLETLLPLALKLIEQGLPRQRVLAALTSAPAALLGVAAGRLQQGAPADLCIVDPEDEWELDPERMLSGGHNTPFAAWHFRGRAQHTLLGTEP